MRRFTLAAAAALSCLTVAPAVAQVAIDPAARGIAVRAAQQAATNATAIGATVVPFVGNSAVATVNANLIQAALNGKGHVTVRCGGTASIASTLYVGSDTRLTIEKGCTLQGVAGTHTMLANRASSNALVPWTATQRQGTGNDGTTAPFSVIWAGSTPAWVASTAYAQSAANNRYVSSGGNLYWLATSSCTSGSTAPTGTGTVSDGACSWTYVTTDKEFTYNGYQSSTTATVYWPAHGRSVGDAVALQAVPDNVATNGSWSGTASSFTNGAYLDSAYMGVFPVVAVNDANWITVSLRRTPGSAASPSLAPDFSGAPMQIKQADQNIVVDGGGTLDYNSPTNTWDGTITAYNAQPMDVVFGWVKNLGVDGLNGANSAKYGLMLAGVSSAVVRSFNTPAGTASDRIKVYGPAFDVTVDGSYGIGGDDVASLQTQDTPTFARYNLGQGDIVGVTIRNVTSDQGLGCVVYPTHQFLWMDDLTFDRCVVKNTLNPNYRGTYTIYGGATITNGRPMIGTVRFLGGSNPMSNWITGLVRTYNGGSSSSCWTVQNLIVDGGVGPLSQTGANSRGALFNTDMLGAGATTSAGCIVNNLSVLNTRTRLSSVGNDAAVTLTSGSFGQVTFANSFVDATSAAGSQYGVFLGANAAVDHVVVRENVFQNINSAARLYAATVIDLTSNRFSSSGALAGIVVNASGSTINLSKNWATGMGLGLVRVNGTYTGTVHSTGDNTLLGSSAFYVQASGTNSFSLLGATDLAALSTPTLTNCGTSPTLTGSSVAGSLTEGTSASSCTMTFGAGYYTTPRCTITSRAGLAFSYALTSSALTVTNSGSLAGTTLDYQCQTSFGTDLPKLPAAANDDAGGEQLSA